MPRAESSSAASLPALSPTQVIVGGVCAVILTIGVARFAYTPLLPIMREQAGLSPIQAGWLATINYIGYLLGALLAASIHSLHRKFVLYRLGLICAVATTVGMGLTHNFWVWMVLRLLSGWSSTAGMLLATGLVLSWLVRHKQRPELGIHFAGFGVGMVISGLAVALMATHFIWAQQWMLLGALGVLFLIPAWRWVPAPQANVASSVASGSGAPSKNWLRVFALAYFCGGFGYVITATFIVDIVRNMHSSVPGNGVWLLMGIAAIPSCVLWDRVAARIGAVRALSAAYALQTVSFALTAWGQNAATLLIAAMLFGATVIGTVSLTLSIVGRMFPANPAKAMARLTVGYGTAQILGPLVAGYLAHIYGDYHLALLFATVIGLSGTLLSWPLGGKRYFPVPQR